MRPSLYAAQRLRASSAQMRSISGSGRSKSARMVSTNRSFSLSERDLISDVSLSVAADIKANYLYVRLAVKAFPVCPSLCACLETRLGEVIGFARSNLPAQRGRFMKRLSPLLVLLSMACALAAATFRLQ